MITLRLDSILEQQLNAAAQNLGLTRSEFIKKSIIHYIETQKTKSSWEIGQDLFGRYASGQGNLSSDRKEILKKTLKAKKGHE